MDQDRFWALIEASHDDDCTQQAEKLSAQLEALSAVEIVLFDQIFTQYFFAAYRHDLWAVAYIINGGCSDDAFMDFRNWLIAKGRRFYESALENPARVADDIDPEAAYAGCEDIGYVAQQSYERLTGMGLPGADYHKLQPKEPLGTSWNEADLPALYPELCAKFDC